MAFQITPVVDTVYLEGSGSKNEYPRWNSTYVILCTTRGAKAPKGSKDAVQNMKSAQRYEKEVSPVVGLQKP